MSKTRPVTEIVENPNDILWSGNSYISSKDKNIIFFKLFFPFLMIIVPYFAFFMTFSSDFNISFIKEYGLFGIFNRSGTFNRFIIIYLIIFHIIGLLTFVFIIFNHSSKNKRLKDTQYVFTDKIFYIIYKKTVLIEYSNIKKIKFFFSNDKDKSDLLIYVNLAYKKSILTISERIGDFFNNLFFRLIDFITSFNVNLTNPKKNKRIYHNHSLFKIKIENMTEYRRLYSIFFNK
ncbi:MAG TPA: hypothetical protein PK771_02300 [Spirochaetota bacterium]|nr:hypothetical protein [Spirochaetota bacterium]